MSQTFVLIYRDFLRDVSQTFVLIYQDFLRDVVRRVLRSCYDVAGCRRGHSRGHSGDTIRRTDSARVAVVADTGNVYIILCRYDPEKSKSNFV